MNEITVNEENLIKFLSKIRKQDKEELIYFLGNNFKSKFINIVLSNFTETTLLEYNSIPACIGGIYKDAYGAQVWLLCSDNYDKKYLFRYIKNKLKLFQNKFDFLYNYIYKSNFSSLKWLQKCGFKVEELKNPNIKLFYYQKGE